MKKLIFVGLVLILIATGPLYGADQKGFAIRQSFTSGMKSNWTIHGMIPWAQHVEEATKGRVKVTQYPDGALHKGKDGLRATATGITDMTNFFQPLMPGRFPLMEMWQLPGLASNQTISTAVLQQLYKKYPAYREQYKNDNVVELFAMILLRADLHTVKPLKSLKDLKGKVIACQNKAGARALAALGASTSIMVGGDAYLAAQKGVVDGIFSAWGWVQTFSLYEVAPYHLLIQLNPGTMSFIMNKDTYNKFTDAEKILVDQFKNQAVNNFINANVRQVQLSWKTIPKENLFELSPEDKAELRKSFKPAWDEWVQKTKALGYPAEDILNDALQLIDAYEAG